MQKSEITLTQQEANELLFMLSEIPIKYLNIIQAVRDILQKKFEEDDIALHNS